jgi:hypothetical protein
MRNLALAAGVALTLALAGCGAPYKADGGGNGGWLSRDGGYGEQQLAPYTYMVRFAGNSWDDRDSVEWKALYRAAEITVREGGDFFVVVASNFRIYAGNGGADPRAGGMPVPQPQFRATSDAGGPQAEAYVRLYSGATPTDLEGAYEARKVIAEGL